MSERLKQIRTKKIVGREIYADRRFVFIFFNSGLHLFNLIELGRTKNHILSVVFLFMNLTAGVADMADGRGCLLSARYYRDFVAGKRAEIISLKTFFRSVIPSKIQLASSQNFEI